MLVPTSTIVHWAPVCAFGGDYDKHWDLSAVAIASWEARNWAAVVLTGRHQCKYRLVIQSVPPAVTTVPVWSSPMLLQSDLASSFMWLIREQGGF